MNELLRLLKRDWPYFLIITAFFMVSVFLGARLPEIAPEVARNLEKQTLDHFSEIAKLMRDADLPSRIMIIWMNNIVASLTAIISGALLVPLLPLIFLMGNGLIIGLVQRMTAAQGLSIVRFYLALLPHGILELPAFFIAVYLGARFSLIPYRLIWHYAKTKEYRSFLKEFLLDFRYYALLFVVMLLVAAVIEMTVSPILVSR